MPDLKNRFIIADSKNRNIAFEQTYYHKWLVDKDKKDIHSINTKIEYLVEHGFVVGVNHLTTMDLMTLQYIEQGYLNFIIRPTLCHD